MSEEAEAIGMLWKAGIGIMGMGGAIIGFFTRRVVSDVDQLKKSDAQCKLDLANFKTEVAKDYSKDVNIQASLKRVYEVMEHGFSEQREYFKDMLDMRKGQK